MNSLFQTEYQVNSIRPLLTRQRQYTWRQPLCVTSHKSRDTNQPPAVVASIQTDPIDVSVKADSSTNTAGIENDGDQFNNSDSSVVPSTLKSTTASVPTTQLTISNEQLNNTLINHPNTMGKTPSILPYGGANINPTISENYMKSFNSRVPLSQQYPHLLNKSKRMTTYDMSRKSRELEKKAGNVIATTAYDPLIRNDATLKQFIRAQSLVDHMCKRFMSEYKEKFVDYTKNGGGTSTVVKEVKKSASPKFRKKDEHFNSVDSQSSSTQTSSSPVDTQSKSTSTNNIEQPILPESISQSSPITIVPKETYTIPLETSKPISPAGMKQYHNHEKRHFPTHKDHIQLQIEQMHSELLQTLQNALVCPQRKPLTHGKTTYTDSYTTKRMRDC